MAMVVETVSCQGLLSLSLPVILAQIASGRRCGFFPLVASEISVYDILRRETLFWFCAGSQPLGCVPFLSCMRRPKFQILITFSFQSAKCETVWFAQLKVIRRHSKIKWLTIHHVLLNTVFCTRGHCQGKLERDKFLFSGMSPVVFVEICFLLGHGLPNPTYLSVFASLASVCFWLWPWTHFWTLLKLGFLTWKAVLVGLNLPDGIFMWRNGPYCITVSCEPRTCPGEVFMILAFWNLVHTCRF